MSQLPVFVYGTLRRGQPNYRRVFAGRTEGERDAILGGAVMHVAPGGAYPFVTGGVGDVIGELITIEPSVYDEVLADLDHLEGYRAGSAGSLYLRTRRHVVADGIPQLSWVYVAGRSLAATASEHTRIPDGDWARHDRRRFEDGSEGRAGARSFRAPAAVYVRAAPPLTSASRSDRSAR